MSQQHEALVIANRVRLDGCVLRRELAAGILTVAEALDDVRAERMQIGRVLTAQHAWGPTKAHRVLGRLGIWPTRRVRDLTDRQKQLLREALER